MKVRGGIMKVHIYLLKNKIRCHEQRFYTFFNGIGVNRDGSLDSKRSSSSMETRNIRAVASKLQLTPSTVHMHDVQGDGKADSPTATDLPAMRQPCAELSRHADRSSCGNDAQDTRGFLE